MRSFLPIVLRSVALAGLLAPAASMAPAVAGATSDRCKLVRIAEWPVQIDRNQIVMRGAINGQAVGVLLDTGAGKSLIFRSAATRLGLPLEPAMGSSTVGVLGVGGGSRADVAHVAELRLGEAVRKDLRILVAGEQEVGNSVALLLGADFLENFEVEFDLSNHAVRVHQSKDCAGVRLAYWANENAGEVPMEQGSRIVIPVKVDGEPIRALLDSGAATSVLASRDARRLGVTPETPGVVPGGCRVGLGTKGVDAWVGQFRSFAIDNELIRDPKLYFADLWQHTTITVTGSHLPRRILDLPDMLLGADFLRTHRVLIAYSQRKVYFSYTGGTVFPTRQGTRCGESDGGLPFR